MSEVAGLHGPAGYLQPAAVRQRPGMPPAAHQGDMVGLYDRLANDYDKLHRRWLRHAGGEAQAALEAVVRAVAGPGSTLLDAGCGTGALARTLIAEGMAPERITVLDPSQAMLDRCADLAVYRIRAGLQAIPSQDAGFDVVTCAWALETVPEPDTALAELCRVVRRGGVLCLVFCADTPAVRWSDWLMRRALTMRGTGRFLNTRVVIDTIERIPGFRVRLLPCHGPVAALIARRS